MNANNDNHEPMRCPLRNEEFASILLEYCDRTLSLDAAMSLEKHFEICPDCRDAVAAQRAVWTALDEFKPESISAGFDDEVLARVAQEERRAKRLAAWPAVSVRRVAPMAAAALVLMAVGLFRGPLTQGAADVEDSARFMKSDLIVDVEQVDNTLDDIEMLRQMGLASPGEAGGNDPLQI